MTADLTTLPRLLAPSMPFRSRAEDELEQLKHRLLNELLATASGEELHAPLRRAANEATSVAWASGFPLLILPTLLEEKAQAVRRQIDRQKGVLRRSEPLRRLAA
jgi:hypothetical protein